MTLSIGLSVDPQHPQWLELAREAEVQRLWAEGDREAAAARVPIGIGLGTNLIGPPDIVRMRLRAYRDCGVTTLRVNPIGSDLRECIAGLEVLLDLVSDVNGSTSLTP